MRRLSSVIARLCGVIGGSLHYIFQLDVGLSLRQDFAHLSDIVLQEVIVQGMRDLHPTNEHERGDVLTTVGDFGQLALEVADIRFEIVALPYLDSEKIVIVSLSLPAGCILGEEQLGHLEAVVRLGRQGIEPI